MTRRQLFDFYQVDGRRWRHPSVVALIRDDGRVKNPEQIIREKARRLVAAAIESGWSGPPFDARILASLLGIRVHLADLDPRHDAFIFPDGNGRLRMTVNSAAYPMRQNFSVAHEIVHTLFPDHYEMIQNRRQRGAQIDPDAELEYLCNVGAAELLLPLEPFQKDVARYGFGLHAVPTLKDRYQASAEAVIRRMVQVDEGVSAAVFLACRLKPSETAAQTQICFDGLVQQPSPKLRVLYSTPSRRFRSFLPRHKSIPDTSCAYAAAGTGRIEAAEEVWDVAGLPRYRVEAMRLTMLGEQEDSPEVAVLLRPARVGQQWAESCS